MHAAHLIVHNEFHGNGRAFAGFESHRTDGRIRRSTPFQDFNVGRFLETQGLVAHIGHPDNRADRRPAQLEITVIIDILFHFELRCSGHFDSGFIWPAAAQKRPDSYQDQTDAGDNQPDWETLFDFLWLKFGFISRQG